MAFVIDVPYENLRLFRHGRHCRITLPDGTKLDGTMGEQLTSVDGAAQTVQVLARAKAPFLPEGLNVKVSVSSTGDGQRRWLLPKQAVQSNADMTEFWIMKVGGNGYAVRQSVTIGNSDGKNIEILSPQLQPQDIVITDGGYGLEDGAKVSLN